MFGIFLIGFVALQVHLYIALNLQGIYYAVNATMFMQKEHQADMIHAGSFHYKMILTAGLFKKLLIAFYIVGHFKMFRCMICFLITDALSVSQDTSIPQ